MVSTFGVAALAVMAALGQAPTIAAITPNCFFNLTLGDNSPLIHYTPPDAWMSLFVNTNPFSWQAGMLGYGQSSHSVYGSGATATIEYPGTMAWATGGMGNTSIDAPLDFKIDGVLQPPATRFDAQWVAISYTDIAVGSHTATFALNPANVDPRAYLHFWGFQHLVGVAAES